MNENGNADNGNTTERPAQKVLYPTLAEATVVKPNGHKQRVFEVLKDGTSQGYIWADSCYEALISWARLDCYGARVAEPKVGALSTKDRGAAKLAELTDDELASMGLARKKVRK